MTRGRPAGSGKRVSQARREATLAERLRAAYDDARYPERWCDYCGQLYQGPAVYCSIACATADAGEGNARND